MILSAMQILPNGQEAMLTKQGDEFKFIAQTTSKLFCPKTERYRFKHRALNMESHDPYQGQLPVVRILV